MVSLLERFLVIPSWLNYLTCVGLTSGERRRYVQVGQREQRLNSLVSSMRLLMMMMMMITMILLMMKIMRKFMTTSMIVVQKHNRRE